MKDGLTRALLVEILLMLAALVAQSYIERQLYSAMTPRAIEPHGKLADTERSTIQLFDRVSPSVVQVASHTGDLSRSEEQEAAPGTDQETMEWSRHLQPKAPFAAEVPVNAPISAGDPRDMLAEIAFERRRPWHQLEAQSVVDHGEAAGREH